MRDFYNLLVRGDTSTDLKLISNDVIVINPVGKTISIDGEIKNMTGISAPYETPQNPDLEIDTLKESLDESVDKIFKYLEK